MSRRVEVGEVLPELVLDVTPTMVVAGAIATRDFMPVHHDKAFANQQGAPDIFMNILSDTAHTSRFLTDWAGPDAMLNDPAHVAQAVVYALTQPLGCVVREMVVCPAQEPSYP